MKVFQVLLGSIMVGYLFTDNWQRISFRFLEEYKDRPDRLVLGKAFTDDLGKTYRGKRNELPAFFSNLLPEEPMRDLVERSLRISPGDDMSLLEAVGRDLPGAVEIIAGGRTVDFEKNEVEAEDGALRFSLAGVQLKFSVLREAEKLTLPVHGQRGEWIVKLDSARFPQLVENEFAVLEWARGAGFDVPECHIQPSSALSQSLLPYAVPETNVLVIRRYDRDGALRIHQEDFAQVTSLPPRLKYDQISYEQCALLVRQIVGEDAYFEFVRRLVFMVASGNTDAHLKNWSLIYPDGVNAKLSPLYDQVCTIAWRDLPRTLALRFSGREHLLQVAKMPSPGSPGKRTRVKSEHSRLYRMCFNASLRHGREPVSTGLCPPTTARPCASIGRAHGSSSLIRFSAGSQARGPPLAPHPPLG